MEQRTPEWYAARAGSLGASQVHDAIARTKSGWAASRENLLVDLVLGRLVGPKPDGFTSAAMQWGVDTEPQARAAYEFMLGASVEEVGLITHPFIVNTHASPDGLVGSEGLIEIKCPQSATHMETLLSRSVPARYITQMQWQMACADRAWCDYVSFDPRFPADMQLYVQRVERDGMRIMELESMVAEFLAEVDARLEQVLALRGAA